MRNQTDIKTAVREANERWEANASDRGLVKVRALPKKQENLMAAEIPLEEV